MTIFTSMKDNPCKRECPNRKVGCHGTCEEYKAYKEKLEKNKALRINEIEMFNDYLCVRTKRKRTGD